MLITFHNGTEFVQNSFVFIKGYNNFLFFFLLKFNFADALNVPRLFLIISAGDGACKAQRQRQPVKAIWRVWSHFSPKHVTCVDVGWRGVGHSTKPSGRYARHPAAHRRRHRQRNYLDWLAKENQSSIYDAQRHCPLSHCREVGEVSIAYLCSLF